MNNLESKLEQFYNDENVQVLFVIGSSKSGKTSVTETFLNNNKIKYLKPEINETKQHFEDSINIFVHVNSDIFFNMLAPSTNSPIDSVNNHNKKRVLFIDDIEAFIAQNKSAKSFLFRILEESKIKCIITSSPADEKRMYDLKKRKLAIDTYKIPTQDQSHDFEDFSHFKDCSIYEIVFNIFNSSNKCLRDLQVGISSDPILISFMMYDNMNALVDDKNKQKVRKAFCDFSVIEDYVFTSVDWSMLDIYTLLQCAYIRYFQNDKHVKHLKDVKFTQIPCRSSQRFCIMKKQTSTQLDKNCTWENLMYMSCDKSKKLDLRQVECQAIHAISSNLE